MSKRVLIVDDSDTVRQQVAIALGQSGFEPLEAADGQQGLTTLQSNNDIAMVICDINMPVMNGIETLKHIRENYGDLPVIMITAQIERLPEIQDMGISGFFPKEGTLEQLEQLLEPIIRMHAKMNSSTKPAP